MTVDPNDAIGGSCLQLTGEAFHLDATIVCGDFDTVKSRSADVKIGGVRRRVCRTGLKCWELGVNMNSAVATAFSDQSRALHALI